MNKLFTAVAIVTGLLLVGSSANAGPSTTVYSHHGKPLATRIMLGDLPSKPNYSDAEIRANNAQAVEDRSIHATRNAAQDYSGNAKDLVGKMLNQANNRCIVCIGR